MSAIPSEAPKPPATKDESAGVTTFDSPPPEDKNKTTEPQDEGPAATEFDSIIPELSAGGTIVLGVGEMQLKKRRDPGVECRIRPVRIRHLLAIGRILTGATRPLNIHALISPVMTARTAQEQDAALAAAFTNLVITVPHSEEEFIDLIFKLVDAVDQMSNDETQLWVDYLNNPDPIDVSSVFMQAYKNEEPRMRELGKALMSMFPQLRKPVAEALESPGQ